MKIEERDGELIVEGRRTWSGLSFTPKQLDGIWPGYSEKCEKEKENSLCGGCAVYHNVTKEQLDDLKSSGYYSVFDGSQINSAEDSDKRVHQEFIGLDGKKHKWEYDKKNYCYHSYMTNEEWLTLNNPEGLANCKKCAMWEHCRNAQHDISTEWSISQKHIDELSHEIDMRILERMNKD